MRHVRYRCREEARKITHHQVEDYLNRRAVHTYTGPWELHVYRTRFAVWRRDEHELMLACDPTLGDYVDTIVTAIEVIAIAEERFFEDVLEEMQG